MIAVIDDDESVRKAIARVLRTAGYTCRGFASGAELLSNWQSARPECLVLDLQMPGASGVEVQRQLKASGINVLTIVITASDERRAINESLAQGASACLRKPVDAQTLFAALELGGMLPERDPMAPAVSKAPSEDLSSTMRGAGTFRDGPSRPS